MIGVGHREASIIWLRVDDMRVDFYHLRAHLLMISMRLCWSADSVVSLSTTAWFLVASWSSWADLLLFFLENEWFPHVYVFTSNVFLAAFLLGFGNEWRLTVLDSHVQIVAQYRFLSLAGRLPFASFSPIWIFPGWLQVQLSVGWPCVLSHHMLCGMLCFQQAFCVGLLLALFVGRPVPWSSVHILSISCLGAVLVPDCLEDIIFG